MSSADARHIKIELDTSLDKDFFNDSHFQEGLEKIRYHSGTANLSIEVCELDPTGQYCLKHTSKGVHDYRLTNEVKHK